MKIIETPLSGLLIIEPQVHKDERGYFLEIFHQQRYSTLDLPLFVQDNLSHSKKNVLRGLHYQASHPQGKLISVTRGEIWDVAVDIRQDSPTFKQWFGMVLDSTHHQQLYIPPGFAHGFCVLSSEAEVLYQCSDFYFPAAEKGIIWNDPDLKITWPIDHPILSPKDAAYPRLQDQLL